MVNFPDPGFVPGVGSPLAPPAAVGVAQLYEDVPWGVAILDTGLNYLHVNEQFAAIQGRSAEVLVGRCVLEIGSGLSADAEERCRRVLRTGRSEESNQPWGRSTARPGAAQWRATYLPLHDDAGRVRGLRILLQDAAPRADLEAALQKSQAELHAQLRFRALIGDLFGRLTAILGESADAEIARALAHIRDFAGADEGCLLRFTDGGRQVCVAQSCGGAERRAWMPEVVSDEEFPWYVDMMRRGDVVWVPRVTDLPPEADAERRRAQAAGVRSHLFLPLANRGEAIGGISLTCFEAERAWSDETVGQLRILAQVVGSVLALNSIELKLRQSVTELTGLRDQLRVQRDRLHEEISVIRPRDEIVDHSAAMRGVIEKIHQVAATDATVLILGETGTGKELIARAIHDLSPRRGKPMVKVNCAALPSALVESELFGREKGAYTGALTRQIGRFELAHGSTILLDEIGDLPLELQGKLLRVLQEGEFERLGSPNTHRVSTRVIAATNCNLLKAVREGKLREDLYYRLNVFSIPVPPLRDRAEDVPPLVWTFIRQFNESMARCVDHVPKPTLEALQRYPWPGNIRQLRNTIEHAMIVSTSRELRVELPSLVSDDVDPETAAQTAGPLHPTLEEVERQHILAVLDATHWRVSGAAGAAELLGVKPTTLESRMAKLGIRRK